MSPSCAENSTLRIFYRIKLAYICLFRAVRELTAESLNRLAVKAPDYMSSNGVYMNELSFTNSVCFSEYCQVS